MNGPIVVDVGNTRIKWGRCERGRVVESAALPPDAPEAWRQQSERWAGALQGAWIVSGVHPQRRDTLVAWLRPRVARVQVLDSHEQLPVVVALDAPQRVGLDRLLNAVAVNHRRERHAAGVIVDAGTAVTVDYVDATGAFRGGAIFPGLHLMAKALHDYTAQLPLVAIDRAESPPGRSTAEAIRVGILHAVVGGVQALVRRYAHDVATDHTLTTFLTGGDGPLLAATPGLGTTVQPWPEMTLEGILHSVPDLAAHG